MTNRELSEQVSSLYTIIEAMQESKNISQRKEIVDHLKSAYTIMIKEQFCLVTKEGK